MSTVSIRLSDVAHARSGDKGDHANIGVVAYTAAGYDWLVRTLTAERVAEYFCELAPQRVERFELPGLGALNFVLYGALAGGASRSLRIDTQGKLLATALLELPLAAPDSADVLAAIRRPPSPPGATRKPGPS